jgi:hypothetical protein
MIPFVNSEIDASAFQCDWGLFMDCFICMLNALLSTQMAVFDVDAAHCRMPVASKDHLHVCISRKGLIHLDHCCCFGCMSSSGIFSRCVDTIVCIFKAFKVNDSLNWADNFTFWHFPLPPDPEPGGTWSYSYNVNHYSGVLQTTWAGLGPQANMPISHSLSNTSGLNGTWWKRQSLSLTRSV